MRLGETPEPINQDSRNQILRDIRSGREKKAKADQRAASVPPGRPTPFEGDQAAYEAAQKGFSESNPAVTVLENRLTAVPGPYWMDLSQQEKDALALWSLSIEDLDAITYKHYPTPGEMDIKKGILMVIGVGAIFGPLLFTRESDAGFPFSVLPKPPDLPFERAPQALPLRTESTAIPSRMVERPALPAPVSIPVQATPIETVSSVVSRPGFTPPPRFSRGFAAQSPAGAPTAAVRSQGAPGNVLRRPDGGQRFIYPKPRPS